MDAIRCTTEADSVRPLLALGLGARNLPSGLCVPAGTYRFCDQGWDLSKPGIYRFASGGYVFRQVLVPSRSSVIDCELTQFIHGYGDADDALATRRLLHLSETRRVWATCTRAAQLVVAVLRQCGHSARVVMGMTMDSWNTFDNGHTLVEVRTSTGWKCFDPTIGAWPLIGGERVSVFSLSEALQRQSAFAFSSQVLGKSIGQAKRSSSPRDYRIENLMASMEMTVDWYRRVMQVPGIWRQGAYWFCVSDESSKEAILAYSSLFRTRETVEFLRDFYAFDSGTGLGSLES